MRQYKAQHEDYRQTRRRGEVVGWASELYSEDLKRRYPSIELVRNTVGWAVRVMRAIRSTARQARRERRPPIQYTMTREGGRGRGTRGEDRTKRSNHAPTQNSSKIYSPRKVEWDQICLCLLCINLEIVEFKVSRILHWGVPQSYSPNSFLSRCNRF